MFLVEVKIGFKKNQKILLSAKYGTPGNELRELKSRKYLHILELIFVHHLLSTVSQMISTQPCRMRSKLVMHSCEVTVHYGEISEEPPPSPEI